jgi:hypothetical protein
MLVRHVMSMMRLSALVLILIATTAAAQSDTPSVALERGRLLMEIHADFNAAISLFSKVVASPKANAQQRAEAGLAIAECHALKENHSAAVAAARRVAAKPAGAEPFARAATELAIDSSGLDDGESDASRMSDLVLLLDGALQNRENAAAAALVEDMQTTVAAMLSERDSDGADTKRKKTPAPGKILADELAALAASEPATMIATFSQSKALAKFRTRSGVKRGDATAPLFRLRDALSSALATNDAERAASSAETLARGLAPIAAGNAETEVALFAIAEGAMLDRLAKLLREGNIVAGRAEHREAWRVMHRSFDTGRALQIPRASRVEAAQTSAFIGALTHVEAALQFQADSEPAKVRACIATGIRALEAIGGNTPTRARAQESARRLAEALQHIEKDDADGAASLLNSELYDSQ